MNPDQINTPAWLDKGLWVAVLGFLFGALNKKLGLTLDPGEVWAALFPLATYILGHKWKTGQALVAQIKARAGNDNTETPAAPAAPAAVLAGA